MDIDDVALARLLAGDAATTLLAVRDEVPADQRGARGDAAAQAVIAAGLAAHRPADAVLSEEALDDPARLTRDRVWIIDPLDGTREFAEGRDDWAVHVALWVDGDLAVGVVALPAQGLLLGSDGPPAPSSAHDPVALVVSRTRPPAAAAALAAAHGWVTVPMGSAGAKVAAVVTGAADVYVHAGGQYEWDSAAPVALARAAGLHASRLDGSPLVYNRPDPLLPDLVVCRPELAATVLATLACLSELPAEGVGA